MIQRASRRASIVYILAFYSVIFLISIFVGHAEPPQLRSPIDTKTIAPGMTEYIFKIDADGDNPEFQLIIAEAKLSAVTLRLLGGSGRLGEGEFNFPTELSDLNQKGAGVLISGAYSQRVGSAFLPLGYLKSDGKVISDHIHHTWIVDTMFCVGSKPGQVSFAPALSANTSAYPSCFQTGPRIFLEGVPIIQKLQNNTAIPNKETALTGRQNYMDTPYVRLFICMNREAAPNIIRFGISTEKVTVWRMLEILPSLAIGDKAACQDVVDLGGNTSAGMVINGDLVAGSDSFLLTSALALVPK